MNEEILEVTEFDLDIRVIETDEAEDVQPDFCTTAYTTSCDSCGTCSTCTRPRC